MGTLKIMPERLCPPGSHDFYFGDPKVERPGCISVILCRKCDLKVLGTNKLSHEDLKWAQGVVEKVKL